MGEFDNPKPFVKWAGGKYKSLKTIKKYLPNKYNTYYEPFVGSGALLFGLMPKKAVINDSNKELINCYKTIKVELQSLINKLKEYANFEDYYYYTRNLDRSSEFSMMTKVEKAARFIYLNHTCYNGLWRVNKRGYMNTPYGFYKNPCFLNEAILKSVNQYLNNNDILLLSCDFSDVFKDVQSGDFIYFDPPYVPINKTSCFTHYTKNAFDKSDHLRLKSIYDELTNKGCKCMLSNSHTSFITDLYKDYKIIEISANRSINSDITKRGKISEVLVINY